MTLQLLRRFVTLKKTEAKVSGLAGDLRDERLKSDIILSSINDGVMLLDSEQSIQLFNPAAADLTGWPATEAIGSNASLVL